MLEAQPLDDPPLGVLARCPWRSPRTLSTGESEADHARGTYSTATAAAGSAPGRRRTPRRRQSGGVLQPAGAAARRGRRRRRAGDQGDQLAATAEQPAQDVVGDPGEVARRRPRSRRAITPSTSPGSQGPAMVIACRAATVTAPWRACRAVAVISRTSWSKERPGSWTASAASPCTWAVVGITATRIVVVLLGGAGRDLGRAHRVAVVGQHDHLAARRGRDLPRADLPVDGPATGAAVHDHGAGLARTALASPGPAATATTARPAARPRLGRARARPARRSGSPAPGAAGPPRCRPRSRRRRRRRARGRSTAPRRRPRPGSRRGRPGAPRSAATAVVVGVEQVHHLVGRPVRPAQVGAGLGQRAGPRDLRAARGRARRPAAAGHGGLGGVEDHAQRRARRRRPPRRRAAPAAARGCGPAPRGPRAAAAMSTSRRARRVRLAAASRRGRLRGGPGHGEDGALHRACRPRRSPPRSASLERLGHHHGVPLVRGRPRRCGGQTAPSISLRITPELPRAPSRAPRVNASAMAGPRSASSPVASRSRMASRAAAR